MKTLLSLFLLVRVCFCQTTSAKLMWRMKPAEIIALRGNLVMLNCFVHGRNITNVGENKFWWYRVDRNIVISKNLQITATDANSDRYSVLLDKYRGVYSLVIRNVSEGDGGLYQCLLKESRNGPQETSDNASLTVLTPPTHGYKPCTMFTQSNIILSPQKNRALRCPKSTDSFWRSVTSNVVTNETVYHSWTSSRQVLHAFFLQNKTTLLSESSENQETVYCAVNSSMLQQFPNRCTLIPRATSTKAIIRPPIIDVTNGATVNFTCSHQDIAVATDYTWDIPVELEVAGIQFVRNGRTIILKGIKGNWGEMLNIVCQVTTEWGVKANATATIAFLHKLITTPVVNAIAKGEEGGKPEVVKPQPKPILPIESQTPAKSNNSALKNISILIGPALGVIILFLLAVIFALCVTKQQTSASKNQLRLTHQLSSSMDPQKTVTLRSAGKPSNRNSRSSRRFSDSFTYRFSRDCEYENIEAYMAKKGQFLGGTTSFQDENNQPMEANVRVKIEMPNSLSTSMPALNACKISSNINSHAANEENYPHYSNHQPISHQPYKPLANGNAYATREQIGFPSLISQDFRDTQHYHVPTTTSTMPHAVIDRSKKAMKPPNPPPRKPSY